MSLLAALARDGCVFLTEAASGETSGASLTPQRLLGRPPGGRNLPGGSFRASFSVPREKQPRSLEGANDRRGNLCSCRRDRPVAPPLSPLAQPARKCTFLTSTFFFLCFVVAMVTQRLLCEDQQSKQTLVPGFLGCLLLVVLASTS